MIAKYVVKVGRMIAKYDIVKVGKIYKIRVTDEDGYVRGFLHSWDSCSGTNKDRYWRKRELAQKFLKGLLETIRDRWEGKS